MAAADGHALLLVGHGSHLSSESSMPVRELARRLDPRSLSADSTSSFDEVGAAFWKEEPALARAFDQFDSRNVTVVPVFMSEGFFTREAVPTELGLPLSPGVAPAGGWLDVRGKRVRYLPPVGTHPGLVGVIVERAREAGAGPEDAVAVLGHGTARNRQSGAAIHEQARLVRERGHFAEVVAVFLDQEPNLRDVLALTSAPTVVAVPFFVSEGWHVGESIPADLALEGGERRADGRVLRYALPVGTHPAVAGVVLDLGRPGEGRRALATPQRVEGRGVGALLAGQHAFELGQLRIDPAAGSIEPLSGAAPSCHAASDFEDLLRHDHAGRYRPLPAARTLPGGWRVEAPGADAIAVAVEAVYPLAFRHIEQAIDGDLRVVSLDEVFARQRGRYAVARELDAGGRAAARDTLCRRRCVKHPVWAGEPWAFAPGSGEVLIPCPEPCSVMLSLCREAALWQRERPAAAAPDPAVPFAAFDRPGNETREDYLRTRYAPEDAALG